MLFQQHPLEFAENRLLLANGKWGTLAGRWIRDMQLQTKQLNEVQINTVVFFPRVSITSKYINLWVSQSTGLNQVRPQSITCVIVNPQSSANTVCILLLIMPTTYILVCQLRSQILPLPCSSPLLLLGRSKGWRKCLCHTWDTGLELLLGLRVSLAVVNLGGVHQTRMISASGSLVTLPFK